MKKSVDIIGLPIISISEGKELGIAKQFVINPLKGCVAALAIDDGKWYYGAKLLAYSAITGIGEYAITIETSEDITTLANAPEFEELLCADITVIGTKVLTKSGRNLGNVNEIIVDSSGKIIVCEIVESSGEIIHIPAQRILTFGKEVLVITDDTETDPITKPLTTIPTNKPITPAINPINKPIPSEEKITMPEKEMSTNHSALTNPNLKFEEKDRKSLLGKKANCRIETNNGMLIVEEGGDITEAILQKAKLAGKFAELTANIE